MLLLLFIVFLLMIAATPTWPHSRSWGYGPSGGLGTLLIILLMLMMLGYFPHHGPIVNSGPVVVQPGL